ncbi:phage protein [Secundilactobacillus malefermentans DSM 5705 = KCTC 3548]|nr:phage protein [Secundilactobacillus malefermentans DSM 5705 = KCTC 3548]QEA31762.1 antitoxin HicB [Secundilactobacillus malefermentans]
MYNLVPEITPKGDHLMKKDMVIYPAIFKQDGKVVFVRIPDLKGGFTQGDDIVDAVKMAEDLIGNLLENETTYPVASNVDKIHLEADEKLIYVTADLAEFRRKYSKTVRKNVTIPEYLNEMAKDQKINVSQLLTKALKEELGV